MERWVNRQFMNLALGEVRNIYPNAKQLAQTTNIAYYKKMYILINF